MKKIIFIILSLTLSTQLLAYSKIIILASFSTQKNAIKSLNRYKKTKNYQEILKLSKKHRFSIHVRPSGKYSIIVIEPLLVKKIGNKVFAKVKKNYKNAYPAKFIAPKSSKPKTIKKEIKKEIKQKVQKIIPKKEITVKQNNAPQTTQHIKPIEPTSVYLDDLGNLGISNIMKYFGIFIFFSVFIYYYRKFKRIYDEY